MIRHFGYNQGAVTLLIELSRLSALVAVARFTGQGVSRTLAGGDKLV